MSKKKQEPKFKDQVTYTFYLGANSKKEIFEMEVYLFEQKDAIFFEMYNEQIPVGGAMIGRDDIDKENPPEDEACKIIVPEAYKFKSHHTLSVYLDGDIEEEINRALKWLHERIEDLKEDWPFVGTSEFLAVKLRDDIDQTEKLTK